MPEKLSGRLPDDAMDMPLVHQAMLLPETYPEGEGPIEYRETHVSRLYLTARHVYKLKKAVNFGFLDFTTLDRRHFYCSEEVRLNRRFAPDTYLEVAEIRRTPEGIRIGARGEVLDFAVHMRRLPAEHMLDRRLAEADPTLPAEMERLGRRLARLHQDSPVCRRDGGESNLEVVRGNWRENFNQSASFSGTTISGHALELLARHVTRFLEENADLLRRREEDGYVRDGHGDLHAEHICLTEPIRIYDCIEFNRRFRIADVAADLAFLLMDLDFRRRRDLAARLREAYTSAWEDDPGIGPLLTFYKIYRAFVRGKVESFLAADTSAAAGTRQQAAIRAREYFNLALGYLCPQMLVLTCGLMGTGKSTFGAALAGILGATLLRSDVLRKELAGALGASGRSAEFGQGIYSPEFNRHTYDLLLQRSREALAGGETVVADATFARRTERERFRLAAAAAGVPCFIAVTGCDRQIALARLDARQAAGSDISDGRRDLFDRQAAAFEPVGAEEDAIRVDTVRDVDYNLHLLLCEIIEQNGMCR